MPHEIERTGQGRWAKGSSGNPAGAKPREQSIASALRKRVDGNAFADRLYAMAMGELPDVPYLVQVSAARLIMSYTDGLPFKVQALERKIDVAVHYYDQPMPPAPSKVITVDAVPRLEAGDQDEVSD